MWSERGWGDWGSPPLRQAPSLPVCKGARPEKIRELALCAGRVLHGHLEVAFGPETSDKPGQKPRCAPCSQ